MNLPDLKRGDDLRNIDLPLAEKNLLGFVVARGEATPNNLYSAWASKSNDIERFKKRVLGYLDKIRHFKIICEDYRSLNNLEATWFIDPPYQVGGHKYVHNKINYEELAEWCKTRNGQVIVCEQVPADWLEFRLLTEVRGLRKNHKELIWTN
jgi:16S rRNA G966 N2-methylase RsmD